MRRMRRSAPPSSHHAWSSHRRPDFVGLIYGLMNLADNKIPLLLSVAGTVMMFMGMGDVVDQAAMQGAIDGMPQ